MKWSTQCAQHKWVAHSVTHTLRGSMTCWVPRCFTVYIDRKSLFFNIWNPWLRTHLNAEKFFPLFLSGTLQVVPFISLLQTLWNVAEQVILASQVKRASSISFRLHCLSHLLPSWNSEFSESVCKWWQAGESSQGEQLSFNARKTVSKCKTHLKI